MSWTVALSVALANAVAGFLFTLFAGWAYMTVLGIHDKDGGGAMAFFFVFAPIAAVTGFVWGLIATGIVGATDWSRFLQALGMAQVLPNALVLLITVGAVLFHQKSSPTGPYTLHIEVELDLSGAAYNAWMGQDSSGYVALRSSPYSTRQLELQEERHEAEHDMHHITVGAQLFSLNPGQQVELHLADGRMLVAELPGLEQPVGDVAAWSTAIPFNSSSAELGTEALAPPVLRYRLLKVTFRA